MTSSPIRLILLHGMIHPSLFLFKNENNPPYSAGTTMASTQWESLNSRSMGLPSRFPSHTLITSFSRISEKLIASPPHKHPMHAEQTPFSKKWSFFIEKPDRFKILSYSGDRWSDMQYPNRNPHFTAQCSHRRNAILHHSEYGTELPFYTNLTSVE